MLTLTDIRQADGRRTFTSTGSSLDATSLADELRGRLTSPEHAM